MNKCITTGMPTVNLAINKSRIKLYNKNSDTPTYYLQKGQEFSIELFNPTKDTVLAKIILNGKPIAQGGLVLRQGERVFLERYIDIPKKFMFDTYEVDNTEEVKKAIEDNGDLKVEFYREQQFFTNHFITTTNLWDTNGTFNTNSIGSVTTSTNNTTMDSLSMDSLSMDSLSDNTNMKSPLRSNLRGKLSKSIETGKVEAGSSSNQELKFVDKTFEIFSFHTIEYKLLPISRKINTSEDIRERTYCTNCGEKQKPNFRFCPKCGTKI